MDTKMKRICFMRIGCGAHEEAFQQLLKNLEGKYEETANPIEADVIVQYFCAHTSYVIEDIYAQMQFLKAIKKRQPNIKLIVCGCAVEVIDFKKLYPIVDFCTKKENMVKNILQFLQEAYVTEEFDVKVENGSASVTIAVGCNRRCSFCKWKYMSMKLTSKPMEKVILEVKRAVEQGANYIFLFAHNATQYGIDLYQKPMLLPLLRELLNSTKDTIFRLAGMTVTEVTKDLYTFIQQQERIWSMQVESQSASNFVRKKMNLGSTVEELETVLDAFSNKAILTNFMIGHPYEGEEEFQETLDFIKRKKLWNVTFGTYQNTPGIVSSRMPQVSEEEKEKRSKRFIQTIKELRKEFFDNLLGKTIKAYASGRSWCNNKEIYLTFEGREINCIILAELMDSAENEERVRRINHGEEMTIRIQEVIHYLDFSYKQRVVLKGELA